MNSLIGSNIFSETQLYMDYESSRDSKLIDADRPVLMRLAVVEYFIRKRLSEPLSEP